MAEDQNKEPNNQNNDENDPYKFFKFAGPENNSDNNKDKKNNNGKKKKLPFWPILLLSLLVVALVDVFFFSKPDNLIDFSEFREKVINGQIVYVELGENYIVGYGPSLATSSDSGKG